MKTRRERKRKERRKMERLLLQGGEYIEYPAFAKQHSQLMIDQGLKAGDLKHFLETGQANTILKAVKSSF